MGVQVVLCRRPITINGLLPPMGWGHEVTIHHSHVHVSSDPPPLRPHTQIRHRDKRHALARLTRASFPFSSPLLISSPLPSSLPRTNPIPMLRSPSGNHLQPELWLHSPLIHRQSYLSTGTIAAAQNHSLQTNSSTPTMHQDPLHPTVAASREVFHTACRVQIPASVFDCRPNSISISAVQLTAAVND